MNLTIMVEIEAKICKGPQGTYKIVCPCNRTCPCVELNVLMIAFPGFIDVFNNYSVIDGYPVLLLVHEYVEIQKDQERVNLLGQDQFIVKPNDKFKQLRPEIHFLKDGKYLNSLYLNEKLDKEHRREYEVMDNNIWNFLVPTVDTHVQVPNTIPTKEYLLRAALESINENYERGLYGLAVAYEYADWSARLFQQSYLMVSHGHGDDVSPHVFHSESAIRQLLKEEFVDNNKMALYKGGQEKWRFLLIDDCANSTLAPIDNSQQTKPEDVREQLEELEISLNVPSQTTTSPAVQHLIQNITKCDIIQRLLEKQGFKVECRLWTSENVSMPDIDIMIEYAETLDRAKEALKIKEYDIILLDYLLDKGEKKESRNYGYELLEEICNLERKSDVYRIGPKDKLFFIFMSAFTMAVQGRLLAQGLNRSEPYWYIDTGACPTNTPQLFTYNLLQLMDKRLNDCGIPDLSSVSILDLVKEIFLPIELAPDHSSVRSRANSHYHQVLSLQYHYRKMMKDVEIPSNFKHGDHLFNIKGSVLVSHFMLENQRLGGLLEHLTELVHMTAFGTIRQWAEMWEEYLYIRAKFEEIDVGRHDFKAVCDYIEEYILNLKAQQR